MVQYGAIDHVPSYNLSHGVVLFVPNCTTRVVPPLLLSYSVLLVGVDNTPTNSNQCSEHMCVSLKCSHAGLSEVLL